MTQDSGAVTPYGYEFDVLPLLKRQCTCNFIPRMIHCEQPIRQLAQLGSIRFTEISTGLKLAVAMQILPTRYDLDATVLA